MLRIFTESRSIFRGGIPLYEAHYEHLTARGFIATTCRETTSGRRHNTRASWLLMQQRNPLNPHFKTSHRLQELPHSSRNTFLKKCGKTNLFSSFHQSKDGKMESVSLNDYGPMNNLCPAQWCNHGHYSINNIVRRTIGLEKQSIIYRLCYKNFVKLQHIG